MNWPQRERVIARLLSEAAGQAPTAADLTPRLHARLAALSTGGVGAVGVAARPQAQRLTARWAIIAVTVALVAALLLSAFTFARPLIFSWFGDSGLKTTALQDATWINRSVTVNGVTLHLEQGYADSARTALTMRIDSSNPHDSPGPDLDGMYLVDMQGHNYPVITASQFDDDNLTLFSPLAQAALSTGQTLTLVVQTMQLANESAMTTIVGPWRITFNIQPRAGRSVAFSAPPQTHNGVTLQPLRLDLAPTGVRLLVRVSGLKPDTSLFGLKHFSTHGPDLGGCVPGQGVCVSSGSTGDGAAMQLRGADGQTLTPGWVEVVTDTAPDVGLLPSATQSVGAGGSAVLAFLFFTPLHATHGAAQVALAQIEIDPISANGPDHYVNGPWTFALPL